MITRWRLSNFKSVRKETELPLAPLTIFAGPNSSGKSTWIQSILLISQTLASKVSSRSVVLNGALTRLGQFDDLHSFNSDVPQISVGWECRPGSRTSSAVEQMEPRPFLPPRWDAEIDRIMCTIAFHVDASDPQYELTQLQPRLSSCEVSCIKQSDSNERASNIRISRVVQKSGEPAKPEKLGISLADNEKPRPGLEFDVRLDQESLAEIREELATAEPVGCVLRHFLPFRLEVRFDKVEEEARIIAATIAEEGSRAPRARRRYLMDEEITIPRSVVDLLNQRLGDLAKPMIEENQVEAPPSITKPITIDNWYERTRKLPMGKRLQLRQKTQELAIEIQKLAKEGRGTEYALTSLGLPEDILDAVHYLDMFFSGSVKYLGPLRDEPKPLYPLAATVDPSDVGLRGEYTAAVFDLHKSRPIRCIPSINFASPSINIQASRISLEGAVVDWLHYLGVAEGIQTRDMGKLGHELKVTTQGVGMPHDLTHVGVGVSQVLPILVTCLLADRDDTLVIEQPELHLHPRVQTLLADFFLSISLLGKQCIIETHSEYIINRLRLRIASYPDESLSNSTKIYFVEKREGISYFRDVVVNRYGAIPDWPEGFFDQSQSEAEEILKAATAKRKKERKGAQSA